MAYFFSFFEQNFGTFAPYTWFNTLIYGFVLSFAVFLLLWIFKRQKIKLNRDFFVAVAPWVVFGATGRALVDAQFMPTNWFFVAPGIYFLMFVLFVFAYGFSVFISRFLKMDWWKLTFGAGFILAMFNIIVVGLRAENVLSFLLVFGVFAVFFAPFVVGFVLKFKPLLQLLTLQNLLVVGGHLFDASATFVALTFFNYTEKHVLPIVVIGAFGPFAFFLLKLFVVISALLLIDHFVIDKDTNNGLKFVLFVLGCAPGIRDLCRMVMES